MNKTLVVTAALMLCASAAAAQQAPQPDPAKLIPWLQQQRNAALDGAAQCYVTATDLQDQIAELKKQLAAAKNEAAKTGPAADKVPAPAGSSLPK